MTSAVGFYLQQLGMTKAELARRAGISRQHAAGIVGGTDNPSASVLARIAEVLGVTPNNLMLEGPPASFEQQRNALLGQPDAADESLLGNRPAFQEFARDAGLLSSLGVTEEELDLVRRARIEGPGPYDKQGVVKLLLLLREWRPDAGAGR